MYIFRLGHVHRKVRGYICDTNIDGVTSTVRLMYIFRLGHVKKMPGVLTITAAHAHVTPPGFKNVSGLAHIFNSVSDTRLSCGQTQWVCVFVSIYTILSSYVQHFKNCPSSK